MRLLLLIPDGVGIRNFFYTDFLKVAKDKGIEIVIWAEADILSLVDSKHKKIALKQEKPLTFFADTTRKIWSAGLIKYQSKKFSNPNYLSYLFRTKPSKLVRKWVFFFEELLIRFFNSQQKLNTIRDIYLKLSRKSKYYDYAKKELSNIKPDYVFCTHQRSSKGVAPMLAAMDLGINTGTFIYSWDNLPKASLFVESKNYFVWSEYMKNEILKYHSDYVRKDNVFVTGTPQFEPYFDESLKLKRNEFAKALNLPIHSKWVCFSGDDITTSPFDQVYLCDFCDAVVQWNKQSEVDKLHIIFRPCPVDFSNRYDEVLLKYQDIITLSRPLWSAVNSNLGWNKIVPKKSDLSLLVNTILHSEFVINLGSTMAFDFALFNKPTIYLAYDPVEKYIWDVSRVYQLLHFESMKDLHPVIWTYNKSNFISDIQTALHSKEAYVYDCKIWFERICASPYNKSSERIIKSIIEQ